MLFNRPNGWDYLSKWSFRKQTILILNKSKLERFDHREITLLKHLTDLAYHSHRLKFDRPELGRANASSRASKTCPSEWRGGQTTSWTSAQTITSDSRSVYVVDLKCSIPGLSLFFVLSNKHFNFYDKKCRESNTCPSEYESPTITTRPDLDFEQRFCAHVSTLRWRFKAAFWTLLWAHLLPLMIERLYVVNLHSVCWGARVHEHWGTPKSLQWGVGVSKTAFWLSMSLCVCFWAALKHDDAFTYEF